MYNTVDTFTIVIQQFGIYITIIRLIWYLTGTRVSRIGDCGAIKNELNKLNVVLPQLQPKKICSGDIPNDCLQLYFKLANK